MDEVFVIIILLGIALGVGGCMADKMSTKPEKQATVATAPQKPPVAETPPPVVPEPSVTEKLDMTFGTTAFWVAAGVTMLLVTIFSYNEVGPVAGALLIAFVAACQFAGNSNPAGYVSTHILNDIIAVLAYAAIGVLWGFFRWFVYLVKKRAELDEKKQSFLARNNITDKSQITDDIKRRWDDIRTNAPRAVDNKSTIVHWIIFWPCSIFCFLLADVVIEAGNTVFAVVSRSFQTMSNYIWRDTGSLA